MAGSTPGNNMGTNETGMVGGKLGNRFRNFSQWWMEGNIPYFLGTFPNRQKMHTEGIQTNSQSFSKFKHCDMLSRSSKMGVRGWTKLQWFFFTRVPEFRLLHSNSGRMGSSYSEPFFWAGLAWRFVLLHVNYFWPQHSMGPASDL